MKKFIQTFFSLITIAFLSLNYSGGAAASGNRALTGAPTDEKLGNGNARTCQECHNNGSFNASLKIEVLDEAGAAAVTKFTPGTIYTIRLTISPASASRFGFQILDLRKSDNVNTKGFSAAGAQASNIQISTISGREYVEQSQRLSSNIINLKWKAPTTNVGSVVFYAVGNAVNNNFNEGGDNGTAAVSLQFDPLTSDVNDLAENIKMELSPNPVTEGVNLTLKSEKARQLRVQLLDISGRVVANDNWQVTSGENQKTIDLSRYTKGAYMVQIIENRNIVSKKIFKF